MKRSKIPGFLICDYQMREVAKPGQLILLLHGYNETGRKSFRLLEPSLPADAWVVAPNGPFPMPRKIQNGVSVGFSWYFYDGTRDEYFIDMALATTYLAGLVKELGALASDLPVRLIGFSQGGYLAPFVAQRLKHAVQVIGIGSEVLVDELAESEGGRIHFRIDSIHGEKDEVVSPAQSRASHARLQGRGVEGEFALLDGVGHEISDAVKRKVAELASKS